MKNKRHLLTLAVAITLANAAHAQVQGPSTGSTPYAVPVNPFVTTYSIATVDNTGANPDDTFARTGGGSPYGMVGIPDGLGAFDNGDRTFTVLMNHELSISQGVPRLHGAIGSFVSKFIVNKDTLAVVSANDLITSVATWNTTLNSGQGGYNTPGAAILGRLCSGDLAPVSAFSFGGLGTTERLFLSGEETGAEGRAFAHIATGANAGLSYELPRLGKFSWENAVASPYAQNKTIVVGTDDTTPGEAYVYVGTKTSSGTEVEKAGLTNGLLYGIKVGVAAAQAEDVPANAARISNPFGISKGGSTTFSLVLGPNSGNVENTTGALLQAAHTTDLVSNFLRPEDAAWDTVSNNKLYFVTTDRYDEIKDNVDGSDGGSLINQVGRSRLWSLTFGDMANPENGGTIKLLLDGAETLANGGLNMMDNIAVDMDGNILIVEDVGGEAHNGKLARYNPVTETIEILAKHDPARFGDLGGTATAPFNNDEEFSGVIDITAIMADSALANGDPNQRWYMFDDQTHYNIAGEQVQGGQLLVASVPEPTTVISLIGGLGMLLGFRRRRS